MRKAPAALIVKCNRLCAALLNVNFQMILQIGANARQVGNKRDFHRLEVRSRPDAAQQQKLRRVDRTAGENDRVLAVNLFAIRRVDFIGAQVVETPHKLDANRFAAREKNARCENVFRGYKIFSV